MKKCPYCAEEIQDEAVKCKHCGSLLDRTPMPGVTGAPTLIGTPGFGVDTPGPITGAETVCREFGIEYRLTGRYEIKREIGRGGMGIVYLAHDNVLDVDVAVKVLPTMFAANPRAIAALKGEARTSMKLSHPNIVRLYNFVESAEANFLVMEYVKGRSLDEIIHQRGSLPWDETLAIGRQVAAALDYAHSQGVLHRDIKPGNIMITGSGADAQAKLADFGIACEMKNTMTRLTGRQTSGTLLYMSPEQLMGDALDARADVYSFAAMLYECLSGRPPFHSGDIPTQIMQKSVAPIAGVPEEINNALRRALSKDKASRQSSCIEVIESKGTQRTQSKPEEKKKEQPAPLPHQQKPPAPPLPRAVVVKKTGLSGGAIAGIVTVLLMLVGVIILAALLSGDSGPEQKREIAKKTDEPSEIPRERTRAETPAKPKPALIQTGEPELSSLYEPVRNEGRETYNGAEYWKEIKHVKSGIVLRLIPAGKFEMGSPSGEKNRDSDEGPVHKVEISQPFYMGKYEATQKEWKTIMGSNPSSFKGENLPVECVSWNKAKEFCEKAGGGLRLPTEAQWEYACRADGKARWCFGDSESTLGEYAWYRDNSGSKTHNVGIKKANKWGLHDMHGNVYEWCEDWEKHYDECKDSVTDPTGPRSGKGRVFRGGSWLINARDLRSANRNGVGLSSTSSNLGFRVVVSAQTPPSSKTVLSSLYEPVRSEGKATYDGIVYWREIKHIKSGIVLRLIPAGEFDMGSPSGEKDRDGDEGPVHKVEISQPFYMGKYEVTQKEWQTVMGSNHSRFKGEDLPVECVSWNDVKEFCVKAGGDLRLPTEAQWEYACRAGTKTPFNTGNNITTDQANYHGNRPYAGNPKGKWREKTTTVGTFKPNAWGLYDMHGNVWEWCEDWYGEDYYSKRENTDPTGPRSGTRRVLRGAPWIGGARYLRSANRDRGGPDNSTIDNFGFRVVASAGAVK